MKGKALWKRVKFEATFKYKRGYYDYSISCSNCMRDNYFLIREGTRISQVKKEFICDKCGCRIIKENKND